MLIQVKGKNGENLGLYECKKEYMDRHSVTDPAKKIAEVFKSLEDQGSLDEADEALSAIGINRTFIDDTVYLNWW